MSARCRACDEEIWWLEHVSTGKKAPIEVEPAADGACLPSLGDGQYRIASKEERAELGPKRQLHRNHFQACPEAQRFR